MQQAIIIVTFPKGHLPSRIGPLSVDDAIKQQEQLVEKIEPGKATVIISNLSTLDEAMEHIKFAGALKK